MMIYLAAAALALAAWGLSYLWRIAPVGAGYKAKVLCSAIFVSGRKLEPNRVDDVSKDSYRILSMLFPAEVDLEAKAVTASCLGFRPRIAAFKPGFGATLDGGPYSGSLRTPGPEEPAAGPAKLQEVVDKSFAEPNPARLRRTRAVVVVQDGKVLAEGYAPGFSALTPLSGWSMTKSVLSALVGVLVGEGKLSVSDKRLLPQWTDGRSEITLEDLLRMRSGLRFSEVYGDLFSDVNQMLFVKPDAAAVAAGKALAAKPGTLWQYASGTTNLLSAIVRRTIGEKDYPDFPRRALFDPLGMTSAVMEPDAAGTFVASSFMFATARDWARFGRLFAQDGVWEGRRLLPEGWVRFCASPTPQSRDGRYGAHWWLKLAKELGGETEDAKRIPPDAFFALGHEGQTLTVIPSLKLVAVRLGLSIYIDAWNQARFLAEVLDALS